MNSEQLKFIVNNIDDQINDLTKTLRRKQNILQYFIQWDSIGGLLAYSQKAEKYNKDGFITNLEDAAQFSDVVYFYDEIYTESEVKADFGQDIKTMDYKDFFKQNGIEI